MEIISVCVCVLIHVYSAKKKYVNPLEQVGFLHYSNWL